MILALLVASATLARPQESQYWSLVASFSPTHSSNIFLTPVNSSRDTVGGGSVVLSYARTRRAYDFGVSGWLFGAAFSNFSTLSGVSGGLVLNGRFSLSPVSTLRLNQTLTKGFNPQRLYGSGAVLPQLDVATSATYLGWGYEATPSTTLNLSTDLNYLRYKSPTLVSTPQLLSDTFFEQATPPTPEDVENPPFFEQPDPSLFALTQIASEGVLSNDLELVTVRVGPALTHQFSERSRGDVAAAYRWSRTNGLRPLGTAYVGRTGLFEVRAGFQRQLSSTVDLSPSYSFQKSTSFPRVSTHNVAGQLDKTFSDRFRLDTFLGYSRSNDETGQFPVGTWTGGGGFSTRFKRGGAVLRVSRTVYQPLGFGRVLATNFGFASASFVPAEKLFIGVYGGLSASRDQLDTTFDFENQFVGAIASYRISRRFALGASYAFRRYQFDPLPAAQTNIIGAFVTYSRIWK